MDSSFNNKTSIISNNATPILEVKNLNKSIGSKVLLKDISFKINSDEIVCLVGKNGAGKSTLMQCINALSFFESGDILIDGISTKISSKTASIKNAISYVPSYEFLINTNATNLIELYFEIYPNFNSSLAYELLGKLEINYHINIKNLSKGEREKLALILGICRDCRIYIFDEPLAGADIISLDVIFDLITKYCKREDSCVLISTHLLNVADNIYDRAVFIDKGIIGDFFKKDLASLGDKFRSFYKG